MVFEKFLDSFNPKKIKNFGISKTIKVVKIEKY